MSNQTGKSKGADKMGNSSMTDPTDNTDNIPNTDHSSRKLHFNPTMSSEAEEASHEEEVEIEDTTLDDTFWVEQFAVLKTFQAQHGHCRVSKLENQTLCNWCHTQRRSAKKNELAKECVDLLSTIGFWETKDAKYSRLWIKKFTLLKIFQAQHGHCRVSKLENQTLCNWCHTQRRSAKKNELAKECVDLLSTIGFWETKDAKFSHLWMQKFTLLKIFQAQHGHCRVSKLENQTLCNWCHTQRRLAKKNELAQQRFDLLSTIAFWDTKYWPSCWIQKFTLLKTFQAKHGHCKVLRLQNEQLHQWCCRQRKSAKENNLVQERIDLLSTIGFWDKVSDCGLSTTVAGDAEKTGCTILRDDRTNSQEDSSTRMHKLTCVKNDRAVALGCLLPSAEANLAESRKRKASTNEENKSHAQDFNADICQVKELQLQSFDSFVLSRGTGREAQDFNSDIYQVEELQTQSFDSFVASRGAGSEAQDFNSDTCQVEELQTQSFDSVFVSRPSGSDAKSGSAQNTQFREGAAASAQKPNKIDCYRSPALVAREAISIKEERI